MLENDGQVFVVI